MTNFTSCEHVLGCAFWLLSSPLSISTWLLLLLFELAATVAAAAAISCSSVSATSSTGDDTDFAFVAVGFAAWLSSSLLVLLLLLLPLLLVVPAVLLLLSGCIFMVMHSAGLAVLDEGLLCEGTLDITMVWLMWWMGRGELLFVDTVALLLFADKLLVLRLLYRFCCCWGSALGEVTDINCSYWGVSSGWCSIELCCECCCCDIFYRYLSSKLFAVFVCCALQVFQSKKYLILRRRLSRGQPAKFRWTCHRI